MDRTFYRTSFDYKNISLDFARRAGEILEVRELAGLLHRTITDSLPVEKLGLALTRTGQSSQNTYLEEISLGEPLDKLRFEPPGAWPPAACWPSQAPFSSAKDSIFRRRNFWPGWAGLWSWFFP